MEPHQMLRKIAELEFINDQLEAELNYIDNLLRSVGFQGGLESMKMSAHEIMRLELEEC